MKSKQLNSLFKLCTILLFVMWSSVNVMAQCESCNTISGDLTEDTDLDNGTVNLNNVEGQCLYSQFPSTSTTIKACFCALGASDPNEAELQTIFAACANENGQIEQCTFTSPQYSFFDILTTSFDFITKVPISIIVQDALPSDAYLLYFEQNTPISTTVNGSPSTSYRTRGIVQGNQQWGIAIGASGIDGGKALNLDRRADTGFSSFDLCLCKESDVNDSTWPQNGFENTCKGGDINQSSGVFYDLPSGSDQLGEQDLCNCDVWDHSDGAADNDAIRAYTIVNYNQNTIAVNSGCNLCSYADPDFSLPIQLTLFNSESEGENVKLYWETASEFNSNYFEVQHSVDGLNYKTIGRVAASGDTEVLRAYEFIHREPSAGYNLYRLKMVDNDNSYEYSPTTLHQYTITDLSLGLYPVPAQNIVKIKNLRKLTREPVEVVIYDLLGMPIKTTNLGQFTNDVDLTGLKDGVYSIQIQYLNQTETFRLVKKSEAK
ncbi:T9SS type A sorting domain-containing protein [Sediminitomix flava]|uniref:Putative secreted protein (Por secretion system target) n=1 Tax=Sediminitomix flava TaxID=379075 RepID=A0A316A2M9_SEDFL|nr:T9SS type A sorting domain-containing protein [Sediminitomix flava]PWJ43967.1 putative secreted protein (Por secretion system target) [Sediminitomix flava]